MAIKPNTTTDANIQSGSLIFHPLFVFSVPNVLFGALLLNFASVALASISCSSRLLSIDLLFCSFSASISAISTSLMKKWLRMTSRIDGGISSKVSSLNRSNVSAPANTDVSATASITLRSGRGTSSTNCGILICNTM